MTLEITTLSPYNQLHVLPVSTLVSITFKVENDSLSLITDLLQQRRGILAALLGVWKLPYLLKIKRNPTSLLRMLYIKNAC